MEAEKLGCGEILLTSMDKDGTESGYDNDIMKTLSRSVRIPLIASGGAGTMDHILETFRAGSDAALAASIFHFGTIRIKDLKKYLSEHNIPVRR
jgi:cyclase